MVNWGSNSPFRCMILATKSSNTNMNRSNRVIIGMQMSATDGQKLMVGSSMIIVVNR